MNEMNTNNWKISEFSDLVGHTIVSIDGGQIGSQEIVFTLSDGKKYRLYHWQSCCESVWVEDITGDIDDLIGSPVLRAEESTQDNSDETYGTSIWTFYKLATRKGYVDIRWNGVSNGYYSVAVSFEQMNIN